MFPVSILTPIVIAVCFVCSIVIGLYAAENYTDGERALRARQTRLQSGDSHAHGRRLMGVGVLQAFAAILLAVAGLSIMTYK